MQCNTGPATGMIDRAVTRLYKYGIHLTAGLAAVSFTLRS